MTVATQFRLHVTYSTVLLNMQFSTHPTFPANYSQCRNRFGLPIPVPVRVTIAVGRGDMEDKSRIRLLQCNLHRHTGDNAEAGKRRRPESNRSTPPDYKTSIALSLLHSSVDAGIHYS